MAEEEELPPAPELQPVADDPEIETENVPQEFATGEENSNPPEEAKQPFKRIDTTILEGLPPELQDNSFSTKFRFGQGDLFGMEGHERLKDKAGKDFRKEKTRFKNRSFQGGGVGRIVYAVNSTKFE